ncbi:MAG TPA: 50S ribosomal protein L11 methyltransferase [Lachnospiraceae bacterium]|nr:50S ribosomal protein L11 methyltransferase [Lachnospiraceae bacterium]
MKWTKFRLKTTTQAEDLVVCALADAGVEGAQIEDNVPLSEQDLQQMFVDIPLTGGPDDGTAYVTFYLDEDEDADAVLRRVEEELAALRQYSDIGPCSIERSETEDKDWINNWKQYFHQFTVDDFLIIPSWEQVRPEDAGKRILHIDPGTAFGTGMHETTQLCIRQLKKYVTDGCEVLDVGTGSGILGIVSLMLGAGHVFGTDLDPCAMDAVKENLQANEIAEGRMEAVIGNLIDDPAVQELAGYGKYDIVTANILAPVLVELTPQIVRCLKPGGVYITSGILDVKEKDVTDACERAGLTVVEVTHQGEWVSVTARRDL